MKFAKYKGEGSFIGKMFSAMGNPPEGVYSLPGGGFSTTPPEAAKLEIARKERCFVTDGYSVGDRGLHKINETDRGGSSEISMSRYLGYIANSVRNVNSVEPKNRDLMLKSYVNQRKAMIETIHRFFGQPGLDIAESTYAAPEHSAVVSTIRERLADPQFSASLSPLELAEYELLTSVPDQFITCVARKSLSSG